MIRHRKTRGETAADGGPSEISVLASTHPELRKTHPDIVEFGRLQNGGLGLVAINTLQEKEAMVWLSAEDASEFIDELLRLFPPSPCPDAPPAGDAP